MSMTTLTHENFYGQFSHPNAWPNTLLATLVKKNEELTLHLIAQQKRIERLEKQNKQLRKK
jgi:hypothetical protein